MYKALHVLHILDIATGQKTVSAALLTNEQNGLLFDDKCSGQRVKRQFFKVPFSGAKPPGGTGGLIREYYSHPTQDMVWRGIKADVVNCDERATVTAGLPSLLKVTVSSVKEIRRGEIKNAPSLQ